MSINVRAFLGVVVAACLGLWAGLPAAAQAPAAFSLTPHEQAWIKQHPVLRVSVLKDLEPIEYLKEGNLHGLSAEFLTEISRMTGLRFTYQCLRRPGGARVDMVKRGEADLISALRINGDVAARSGMLLTEPYHISAAIVITRVKRPFLFEPDQLNGMTVTLPFLDRYHDELRRKAPGATLVRGDRRAGCWSRWPAARPTRRSVPRPSWCRTCIAAIRGNCRYRACCRA
ncbi:transporter substrate-binding domain-containing protein [Achromobacter xylosoxidans]